MAGDGMDEKAVAPIRSAAVKNGRYVGSEGQVARRAAKSDGALRFPRIIRLLCGKPTVINANEKSARLFPMSKLSKTENNQTERHEYDDFFH